MVLAVENIVVDGGSIAGVVGGILIEGTEVVGMALLAGETVVDGVDSTVAGSTVVDVVRFRKRLEVEVDSIEVVLIAVLSTLVPDAIGVSFHIKAEAITAKTLERNSCYRLGG